MKKNTVYTAIAAMVASVAISGCSTTKDVTPTIAPVQKPAAVQTVLGDYALLAGHILYQDANNAYSIQLPENAEINDENPDNIIITIATEAGHTNTVNIKYAEKPKIWRKILPNVVTSLPFCLPKVYATQWYVIFFGSFPR